MKHEAGKRGDSDNDAAGESPKQRLPGSTSNQPPRRPFRAVLSMHIRARGQAFQPGTSYGSRI